MRGSVGPELELALGSPGLDELLELVGVPTLVAPGDSDEDDEDDPETEEPLPVDG